MKVSSIEFLQQQLDCLAKERNQGLIDAETFYKQKKVILNQAKEMHKQEVIDDYARGYIDGVAKNKITAEQYYNETYNIKR